MKEKVVIVEDQFVEAYYLRTMLTKAGYQVCGIARSVTEALLLIETEKPRLVLLDIFLKGKQTGIDLAKTLKEEGIAFIFLSANSNEETLNAAKATEPYGFLVKPFREKDLLITLEVARYRYEQGVDARWRREKELQRHLQNIQKEESGWTQKAIKIVRVLQQYLSFDLMSIQCKPIGTRHYSILAFLRINFEEYQTLGVPELATITALPPEELKQLLIETPDDRIPGVYNETDFKKLLQRNPMKALLAKTFNLSSNIIFPFFSPDGLECTLTFFRRLPDGYTVENLDLLFRFQQLIANSLASIPIAEKGGTSIQAAVPKNSITEQVVKTNTSFKEIIGSSSLLLNVMDFIHQVAPLETSVLLLGESGTGKERMADWVHYLSPRKAKPFIKLNCATLPTNLIESELFGHEKGAFTSAHERRIGKFELANGGTIFLDEIGEMPLESQVKLLRVLQEKEIERIGGRAPIKIDVRIIAATNRNLEKEVAEGRFRLDLYYRIHVFPIVLPPLRERLEDIPALVSHFIQRYNQKAGKKVVGISEKVFKKFTAYHWPGNVRELEHMIERGVLLAKGTMIEDVELPVFQPNPGADTMAAQRTKTIAENERDHILAVLKQCNGRIWGAGAAAALLNIPPSTLKSKMKKLGIKKVYME